MNCAEFDRLLDSLLDGTCSPDEWRRAEAHRGGCARCRQLLDALSGRSTSDLLDEAGHASFTAAVLARTSGSPCVAARDRLCDYVDNALPSFDHGLVEAHLERCQSCSALAGALARANAVLPLFAELVPPGSLATAVLAATSRRGAQPSIGEQVAAWLARAAMRPRFSVSVAYVATLLIVLVLGDPVRAVRQTMDQGSAYVQPVVVAVGEQIVARMDGARRLGAETISAASALTERPEGAAVNWDAGVSAVRKWLAANLGAPLASAIERVSQWIQQTMDALARLVRGEPAAPTPPAASSPQTPARTSGPAEPFRPPVRLS
jgi:predicted anti-sigma-YlaC factor YlaD